MSQPPPLLEYGSRPEHLREIAGRQRALILCILGYLILYGTLLALQSSGPSLMVLALAVSVLGVAITAAVFVFLLAVKVYGPARGTLLGILTLVPCIGLIVLLMINGKATEILKKNGVKVGFLGASI